jgi:hypothetical protein
MGKTWREVKALANQRKDGEASQEPYIPFGTKGTKSSQVYKLLLHLTHFTKQCRKY